MSVEQENHHHRPRTLSLTATAEHGHDVLSQQHQQQQQHTPLVLWPKNFHPKDSSTPGQTSSGTGSCICRICHSGETSVLSINGRKCERLISPCNCSGSVGLVHKSCLEKWLSVSEEIKCELCGFDFSVRTKGKSVWTWMKDKEETPLLTGDFICFLLLTPMAGFSAYLLFVGVVCFMGGAQAEAVSLLFLSGFLCVVYLLWFCLTFKFHVDNWREWSTRNREVHLLHEIKVEKH